MLRHGEAVHSVFMQTKTTPPYRFVIAARASRSSSSIPCSAEIMLCQLALTIGAPFRIDALALNPLRTPAAQLGHEKFEALTLGAEIPRACAQFQRASNEQFSVADCLRQSSAMYSRLEWLKTTRERYFRCG